MSDPRHKAVSLGRGPASILAQTLVDHVARDAGVRALAVKGPLLSRLGLRPPRVSSDADALVEPARVALVRAGLEERGWQIRYEREMPFLLARHSVTMVHPQWPVDIDLHWYFPGLHAEPDEVFERLWERRMEMVLAGRTVRCLDVPGNIVVAAAHCLRYPTSPIRQREFAELVTRVAAQPQEVLDDVVALATATRCLSVLRDFWVQLGMRVPEDDLSVDELRRWLRYTGTHERGSTGAWLAALSRGGPLQRIRVAARALWPSSAELAAMHPRVEQATRRQRLGLRAARWRRGLSAVPGAIRGLRSPHA